MGRYAGVISKILDGTDVNKAISNAVVQNRNSLAKKILSSSKNVAFLAKSNNVADLTSYISENYSGMVGQLSQRDLDKLSKCIISLAGGDKA